jgi:hypothetical protein
MDSAPGKVELEYRNRIGRVPGIIEGTPAVLSRKRWFRARAGARLVLRPAIRSRSQAPIFNPSFGCVTRQ